MSDNKMWMGTRGYMTWVDCPSVEMPSSKVNWNSKIDFLNGGSRVRSSVGAHKEYTLSWLMRNYEDIAPIMDMADGLYGTGPIYFCDPFAMDKNALPQSWASPMQAGYDGIILDNSRTRPQLVPTSANSLNYPIESAVFNVVPPAPGKEIYEQFIPIPPGYTAHVGAHGVDGSGGTVEVTIATGPTAIGATTTLALLPVDTTQRFNFTATSAEGIGILLSLGGSGTITLSGLMVHLLPTGRQPEPGGFISGQGNSGCSFREQPAYTPYSAAFDTAGLTCDLIETESWRIVPNL